MKKNYLIGAFAAATGLLAVANTVLTPERIDDSAVPMVKAVSVADFPTCPAMNEWNFAEGWTVINQGDDNTWKPNMRGNKLCADSQCSDWQSGNMDDYLLSPKVLMKAGSEYTITMNYRVGSSLMPENFAVYVSTSEDPTEIKASTQIFKSENCTNDTYSDVTMTFTPNEDGEYHIIFHCYSNEDQYGVWISEVTISGGGDEPAPVIDPIEIPANFSLATQEDFSEWKVRTGDNSDNNSSWAFSTDHNLAEYHVRHYGQDDDWLISPLIEVKEAGYYNVTIDGIMAENGQSNFTIAAGENADIASMVVKSDEFSLHTGEVSGEFTPIVKTIYLEAGNQYLALHNQLSESYITPEGFSGTYYYIKGIDVSVATSIPSPVTDLVAVGAEDRSNNLVVSWTDPVEDNLGNQMAAKGFKVKIYLNDEETPVATVDNGVQTCTIEVTAGVYNVKAIVESIDGKAASEPVSVKSGWVGSVSVNIPYSTDFNPNTDPAVGIWESFIIDGSHNGKTFELVQTDDSYDFRIKVDDYEQDFKEFILSPYMELSAGVYNLSFLFDDANNDSTHPIPVTVGYCKAGTFNPDAYKTSMTVIAEETLGDSFEAYPRDYTVYIKEAGTYQFVVGEVAREAGYHDGLKFKSFGIDTATAYPGNVTELKVEFDPENEDEAVVSWINPAFVYDTEMPLASIESVVILRDGEQIGDIYDVEPGQASSFTDNLSEGGIYTYTVYATIDGEGHGGEYATVTTPWIGPGLDGDQTFNRENDFTIHDAHGDRTVIGEDVYYAWYYNTRNDRFDYRHDGNGNDADDIIKTKPVKLNKNELYKVTVEVVAHSTNIDSDVYSASVKMGKGEDHASYSEIGKLEVPVDNGQFNRQELSYYVVVGNTSTPAMLSRKVTRAADGDIDDILQKYNAAAKVSEGSHAIAIHTTNAGNLSLYSVKFEKEADLPDIATGIESITVDGIYISDNVVFFPGEAEVAVYNVSGVCVAKASACVDSFELPALAPGYYIITINDKALKVILK